jgi:hypothetical protein
MIRASSSRRTARPDIRLVGDDATMVLATDSWYRPIVGPHPGGNMTQSVSPPLVAAPQDQPVRRTRFALSPVTQIIAVGLSVLEWIVVRGPENGGTILAALLALTMTAPLLFVRRRPVTVAVVIAVAALANGLIVGDLVRCAGAFPAAVVVAFAIGAWARSNSRGWGMTVLGLAGVLGSLLAQWVWDPALNTSWDFAWFGPAVALLAWLAGLGFAAVLARRAAR